MPLRCSEQEQTHQSGQDNKEQAAFLLTVQASSATKENQSPEHSPPNLLTNKIIRLGKDKISHPTLITIRRLVIKNKPLKQQIHKRSFGEHNIVAKEVEG